MEINVNSRNIGIRFNQSGEASISLWAPLAQSAELVNFTNGKTIMLSKSDQYFEAYTSALLPHHRYKLKIDDGKPLPDPASLSQPEGVHAASEAVDLNGFIWNDREWKNIPLEQYIIYEVHTGTFSDSHDFKGIEEKLDHLIELGINAIEIMPVGQFPGQRNWGYDGVYPFAVQSSYGGATALQQLVDACHRKGIAVILDVIYNHLGPEGNYLMEFGPYFTEKYSTPWGKALNFDDAWCDGVRQYFVENVLMWFRDFHIDALRMDAVHAIKDFSARHIIREIREYANELMRNTGRNHYLIAEMDLNDPLYINPVDKGGYGVDAQWIDEFHHALRVAAGQQPEGYYSDFNGIHHLAKSYTDAYVYDGQFSIHRKKKFGAKTANPGKQFVVFSQNHDHVGNRMMGERTSRLVSTDMCKLMAAAVMISPYIPLLFMGEEWGETHPFLFFIDHTDKELAALVNKGRKAEFSSFNWEGEAPDPRLEKTFTDSMLQWELLKNPQHHSILEYYKQLIAFRKSEPALNHLNRNNTSAKVTENNLLIVEREHEGQRLACILNFNKEVKQHEFSGEPVFNSVLHHQPRQIPPESILIFKPI